MSREETVIPGFRWFHNVVQHENMNPLKNCAPLLEVKNNELNASTLDKPLRYLLDELNFVLDEKWSYPDSPVLKAYTMNKSLPLSVARASIWTLLPVFCGDGSMLSCLLLQRCQTIAVDAAKFLVAH